MEKMLPEQRSNSRASLVFGTIFLVILAVLFQGDPSVAPSNSLDGAFDYASMKRTLRKFRKGTYKKGCRAFLLDWKASIRKAREAAERSDRERVERERRLYEKRLERERRRAEKENR